MEHVQDPLIISMFDDPHANFVSFMSEHLVAISCIDRTPGIRANANDGFGTPLFFTAFLLDIDGFIILVTAGHILKDVESALKGEGRFERWEIHDGLSSNSKYYDSIPFPFSLEATAHWVTDDGADYGLVRLNRLISAAILANGKKPIERLAWNKNLAMSFDFYFMLGIPTEFQDATHTSSGSLTIEITPTLVPLTKLDEPPSEIISDIPRFYGQLPASLVNHEGIELNDIDGMSGGPIFGFRKVDGRLKYWAIAIQSGWWRSSKIINACWIKPMAEEIAAILGT